MTGIERVGVINAPVESPAVARRVARAIDWLRRLDLPERRDRLVVAALVVLAFVLRVPNLGRAFWVDEGISVGISSHPLSQIPGVLRLDGSPPLWYFLLHVWIRLFGSSVDATHLLPLGISLLVIPVAYVCGRRLFGRPAGVAAAVLSATNPFLGWYATETRMYTLVVLLAMVALTCTVVAVRESSRRHLVGAVVAFAALVYTHDWSLYLCAMTAAVLLVRAWQTHDRRLALGVIGAGVGVLVLYSPWLPTFIFQVQTTAAPWAVPPQIGDLFADPSSTLAGTLDVVVVPFMAVAVWYTHRLRPRPDRFVTTVLGTIGIGTALLGWLASQIEPSWTIRYLAVMLAPLLLALAGALASSFRGRVAVAIIAVVLTLGSAVGSLLPNANARYAKSNVGAIAAAASSRLRPGDLVITAQTEQLAVLYYYLPEGLTYASPTGITTDPQVVDWRNIVRRLQRANVCRTLLPALRALPVGRAVLEINPLRAIGSSGSAWSDASDKQWAAVDSLLAGQPGLRLGPSYAEGTNPKPYSAVEGQLFVRTAGAITCR
jgi:4-amino-4-deoxy-L-arabinose transferase-like glycosyltransferase